MGQELLLEKDSCGPVSLGVDGGCVMVGGGVTRNSRARHFRSVCGALPAPVSALSSRSREERK